jgi:Domain of unknown function (DUF4349)
MPAQNSKNTRIALGIIGIILAFIVLCVVASFAINHHAQSASMNASGASIAKSPPDSFSSTDGSTTRSASGTNNGQSANAQSVSSGPPYLIKTLNVGLAVNDTRKTADDLQAWIAATDPKSTSAGINVESMDNNQFRISLNFRVQANLYPQIQQYLSNYASQHDGRLLNLQESVQDVSNDYVDTQSRITNLQTELQRLRDLLNRAQSLSDILSIEQRLTDVEGQLEQLEAHLQSLTGQVTFYSITIALQPLSSVVQPAPKQTSWDPGKVLHDAFSSAISFSQWLVTLLIWLAIFSIFIIPAALIVWFIWRAVSGRRNAELSSTVS